MKTNKIKNSIMFKILAPMLLFLVLQTIVILSVFFASNIVKSSKENAYDAFNEKVITRKSYAEKEMYQRFGSFDNAMDNINKTINDMVIGAESGIDYGPEKGDIFLNNTLQILIETIKSNGVTGAYIILADGEPNLSKLDGVYLRCETPLAAYPDSIYINVATPYVREHGLKGKATNETNTKEYFDFSGDSAEFDYFLKPYNAVKNSYKIEQNTYYAYWAMPHQILKGGKRVMSYSVPLFYNEKMYGIFGIDVSTEYMQKYLPQAELDNNNQAAYALCSVAGDNIYNTMVKSGTFYTTALGSSSLINLTACKDSSSEKNYYIKTDKKNDRSYSVCATDLNLYISNAHFKDEKITLIGMVSTDELLAFTNKMTDTIILTLILTDIAGIALIILVAFYISKPVARLPLKVLEYSKNTGERIHRTGIYEIDTLITSIEQLSESVTQNSFKMSKIIALCGAPLGAFELNKTDNRLTFTDKMAELLDNPNLATSKISGQDFRLYLSGLERHRIDSDDYNQLYTFITKSGETRFVTLQTVENDKYFIGVAQDVTKERINRTRIEYERDYDVLTSLLNRRAFLTSAKKLFSSDKDFIGCAAIVLMDMDNLKIINDTFGHEQGDDYLCTMAKTLKAFLSDNRVYISRYSGDEYVMLLYGYENKRQLKEEIDRLAIFVSESCMTMATNQKVKLRCSGGIAYYPDDASNLDELISYADYAMYEIKQTTKGKFNEFNKESYSNREYRTQNYEKLNILIEKNLVDYKFQPIVCLNTGKVLGYEALMRSLEPSFTNPQEILNLASAQHKLYFIERLTWFNALKKYSERYTNSSSLLFVNSISNHIMTDEDINFLQTTYAQLLDKLVIEFTESGKLNEDYADSKKEIIKRWGGKVALDDFGAGYSNDAVLLILNPYYIKVDMFIIRDCDTNESKRRLLKNIVAYAFDRKIKVIAEGVETRAELETIMRCNVDYVQGFYVGMPEFIPQDIPEEKTSEILELKAQIQNQG